MYSSSAFDTIQAQRDGIVHAEAATAEDTYQQSLRLTQAQEVIDECLTTLDTDMLLPLVEAIRQDRALTTAERETFVAHFTTQLEIAFELCRRDVERRL